MDPGERPQPSRRALRERAEPGVGAVGFGDVAVGLGGSGDDAPAPVDGAVATISPDDSAAARGSAEDTPPSAVATIAPTTTTVGATGATRRSALTWVDAASVTAVRPLPLDLGVAASGYIPVEPDLLGTPPRRSPLRPGVLVPASIVAFLAAVYAGGTMLWPLHEVAPTVEAVAVDPIPAAVAAPAFPAVGSAAVSVAGIPGAPATTADPQSIASITKVVTALVVLEEMPLDVGEQGPEYWFTYADSDAYWAYRSNDESALDVPVGGTLTQYQLLQGMLIGSANNYADRLAENLWPSDRVYADAANSWLDAHGVSGIRVTDPSGIEYDNTATPAALLVLAEKALANPVIAEIVRTPAVDLPGAGHVVNTNALLADPGMVGVKTGSLDTFNVLAAKDVPVGDTTVRVYASILGQPDDAARLAAARAVFAQVEAELQPAPSVAAGTTAGHVETEWGERVAVTTASDADVILWNGGQGTVSTTFALGDDRARGDTVGSLSVAGPLDSTSVELRLADDVEGPSPWWRLTHPLQLLGLDD